jgi:hypothetical protein
MGADQVVVKSFEGGRSFPSSDHRLVWVDLRVGG